MKVGMLVDTYLPLIGGAEIHVVELSRALSKRGLDISICTCMPGQDEGEFPVLRLPGLNGGGWRALLRMPLALPALLRYMRGLDVIHCHYSFLLAGLGVVLGRLLKKHTLVTLHGLGTLDSSVGKRPLWRLYRYVSLKWAGTVIATSEEMAAVARRFTSHHRIVIIPNGVDTERFTPQPADQEPDGPVILTMRRLAPKNGVQYLVEATPRILAAVPRARFWMTGEGKLEAHIRQRVSALGVEGNVRFIGMVPHEETPGYYQQADIVVFPSSAESTSLACLEAMAMEKAVVASSLAVYRMMLGENERGLLVQLFDREESDYNAPVALPAERIEALAEAVIRLAQDADLRRKLGRKARAYVVEHYDWKRIAEATAALYLARR